MKKYIIKVLMLSGLIITGTSMFSTVALGYDKDCNRFGAKCHVEDIDTIHTDDKTVTAGLLDTVKNAINWCLGILATLVLCFCIYGGFKMLTSGSDSKGYDAGWKILKNALIGLTVILLAWMIVSVIFWFVSRMSGRNQTESAGIEAVGG